MSKNKNRIKPRANRTLWIAAAVILLLAGGAFYYFNYYRPAHQPKPTEQPSNLVSQDKTHSATSEGSTFQVPDNVPSTAVTDYTLVTDNEEYKIRKDPNSETYIITLYAIINRPDQYDAYKQQLAQYKQDALQYLKNQGVDVSKVKITYEPSEATNL